MEARNQAIAEAIANANAYLNNVAIPNYSDLIKQVAQQNDALANDNRVVLVEVRTVYGNTMIYPANKAAEILAAIAGKKTLSVADLQNAGLLGFEVVEISKNYGLIAALASEVAQ